LSSTAFAAEAQPDAAGEDFPAWITSQDPPYDAKGKIDPFVSFVKVREYELMQAAKKAKIEKRPPRLWRRWMCAA
jgi:hypothetical protein